MNFRFDALGLGEGLSSSKHEPRESPRDREIRQVVFPDDLVMPPGCNIKGKYAVRARVTGNLGIYHLQACRSYPGLKQDRWFCSEEQAQADGFRRAYNCRSPSKVR